MLLITLEKAAVDCRVELDGIDISQRVTGIELSAHVNCKTEVRLFLVTPVTIIGEAGRLEVTHETPDADARRTGDGDQIPRADSGDDDQR